MEQWQTAPRQAGKLVCQPRQAQLPWWYHPQQRQLQVRALCNGCAPSTSSACKISLKAGAIEQHMYSR